MSKKRGLYKYINYDDKHSEFDDKDYLDDDLDDEDKPKIAA